MTCPECDGRLRKRGTETVCEKCGLVSEEDAIDRGPEWRSFDDDDTDRRRTGAPLTRSRHDRGLSTEIGYASGSDSYSSRLTGRKRRQIARLRREHNRARVSSKVERNQIYGFAEIRRVHALLSLPDTVREVVFPVQVSPIRGTTPGTITRGFPQPRFMRPVECVRSPNHRRNRRRCPCRRERTQGGIQRIESGVRTPDRADRSQPVSTEIRLETRSRDECRTAGP